MAALSNRNHRGFYVHSLLFAVCIFYTFLWLQVDGVKAGRGGSSIDLSSRLIEKSDDNSSQTCSNDDIAVIQVNGEWSNGIRLFNVDIINECSSGCGISNIHVNCGDFTSAVFIDPKVFRKLSIGDCLVNDGQTLDIGASLSFSYANSFSYSLTVASVTCAA